MDNYPMRLWSLHPKYLDSKGLVALWREGLLAKKVLAGKTDSYKNHPQLIRFRESADANLYINHYLAHVFSESLRRGYNFNKEKLDPAFKYENMPEKLLVTSGQLAYELEHLRQKLVERDSVAWEAIADVTTPAPHPLFRVVDGEVADWERV